MSIKVGIFGDSYANAEHGHGKFPEMRDNAWFYKLDSQYEVCSYGVAGASNYYSYTEFLQHHSKYDKNIFLISYPGRHPSSEIYIENNPKFDYLGKGKGVDFEKGKRLFPSSAGTTDYMIRRHKEYNLDDDTLERLKAMRDYYVFLEHREYDITITEFFVKHILEIRPDTIIINLFYERFYKEPVELWAKPLITTVTGPSFLQYNDSMMKGIEPKKSQSYEFPHQIAAKYFEIRCTCHFSEETNLVVANHVNETLSTGIWNPIVPSIIPHAVMDLGYYFDVKNPGDDHDIPGF